MPVYNDWKSAASLLSRLVPHCTAQARRLSVLMVDDGSTQNLPTDFSAVSKQGASLTLIKLTRNLGHQRALAIGLAYAADVLTDSDALVVMDSDGEDSPEEIPRLLLEMQQSTGPVIVVAGRTRRFEGLTFRTGYYIYRFLFRVLTGKTIRFGNFSVIPRAMLRRVVSISEIWNHYAAAIIHAKLPLRPVPTPRAKRLEGRSSMNKVSLITHGLSAISIFADVVGVRMLIAASVVGSLLLLLIGTTIYVRLATDLAIPGWTTNVIGLLSIILVQIFGLALQFTFMILQSRSGSLFLPLRDYRFYVDEITQLI